jgi:hypothetical protein
MIKKIWDFCGDIKVNFWLILAISLNLAIGSYFIRYNPKLFAPLNQSLIQDWFMEYGQYQPGKICWLAIFLVLAFFLGTNTFACAAKRIIQLWPQKNQLGFRMFSIKIAPSLVHLLFLIVLAGHFASLIIGYQQNIPVQLNQKIYLPEGNSVEVISQYIERYTAPKAFDGAIRQCTVILKIRNKEAVGTKELSVLNPVYWQGMSIHLDVLTKRDSQKTEASPELKLIVKKDPGIAVVIMCFAAICLLMLWYFPQRKKPEESKSGFRENGNLFQ